MHILPVMCIITNTNEYSSEGENANIYAEMIRFTALMSFCATTTQVFPSIFAEILNK